MDREPHIALTRQPRTVGAVQDYDVAMGSVPYEQPEAGIAF